jgi:hypothetical protein
MTISIIWNPNVGHNQNTGAEHLTVLQQYPGDDFVDVLGIDTYGFPISRNNDPAETTANPVRYLLTTMLEMARARGKPIAGCEIGGIDTKFAATLVQVLTHVKMTIAFIALWDINDSNGNLSWSNPGDGQAELAAIWSRALGRDGSITNC